MSLSRKFTLWITSIVLLLGSLSAYLYYSFERKEEVERLESLGNIAGQLLEQGLENYMLTKDYSVLDKTLHNLKDIKSISRMLLINREGVIKAGPGTDNKAVGTKLSPTDPRCQRCHEKGERGYIFRDENVFMWTQPIRNKPECHKCHSPSAKNNGIFLIDFSLSESEKQVKKDILRGFLVFIPSIIIISIVVILLSNRLVIKRLSTMADKIKRFKEGDYSARLTVERNDEITRLEENFNEMAEVIKMRDDAIVESQKEWQETFDSITDLVSIHDKDFNIIKANKSVSNYCGLDIKEIIGRKCYKLFHDCDVPVSNCPHKKTMHGGQSQIEEVVYPKTNKILRVMTFPYTSPEGEFIGSIHVARDITEEQEREIRLIMSERLAALGQMASGIAHEINNPLATIAGCTEGLLNRAKIGKFEPELFENYLNIIEEEILRCKGITASMLSFARTTTYEKKKIDIINLIEKTLELISFQGRLKEVKVELKYKEGMPAVYGSEGELRQVFLAIITNALDAMNDKGILTIETGTEGEMLFVKNSDTGHGIPMEYIDKIFNPFFTTKSERGGTGLGLSIARKIIMDHNGTIDIFSEEGKGTTIKITLPVCKNHII